MKTNMSEGATVQCSQVTLSSMWAQWCLAPSWCRISKDFTLCSRCVTWRSAPLKKLFVRSSPASNQAPWSESKNSPTTPSSTTAAATTPSPRWASWTELRSTGPQWRWRWPNQLGSKMEAWLGGGATTTGDTWEMQLEEGMGPLFCTGMMEGWWEDLSTRALLWVPCLCYLHWGASSTQEQLQVRRLDKKCIEQL